MGLRGPVSCRSVFRIWRANASRLAAEPGVVSVLVVGGVTTLVPRPCQHGPFRLWVGKGVGPAVPTRKAWRTW